LIRGRFVAKPGGVTFLRCAIVLAVLPTAILGSMCETARAQAVPPPQYVPTDAYPPPSVRWKLVLGGAATTAGFYALAQPFSYAWPDAPGGRDLRIPIAGPWIAIRNNGCPADNPDCSTFWVWTRGILTALDGLGQAGGILISLEGIFATTSEDEPVEEVDRPRRRPDTEQPREEPPPRNLFVAPSPMGVGSRGLGLSVSGTF